MNRIIIFLGGLIVSFTSSAVTLFTADDVVQLYELGEGAYEESEPCDGVYYLRLSCEGIRKHLNEKLAGLKPFIKNGAVVYEGDVPNSKSGDVSMKSFSYKVTLDGDVPLDLSDSAKKIEGVRYPVILGTTLNFYINGSGYFRKHDVDWFGNDLDYDFDVDGYGSAELVAALSFKPRLITDNEGHLRYFVEPKLRLFADRPDLDISIDVENGDWYNPVLSGLGSITSFVELGFDAILDWGDLDDTWMDFRHNLTGTFQSLILMIDDPLQFDGYLADKIGDSIVDHELDYDWDRWLYSQEVELNRQLLLYTGADENGLVKYDADDHKGEAAAIILSILTIF